MERILIKLNNMKTLYLILFSFFICTNYAQEYSDKRIIVVIKNNTKQVKNLHEFDELEFLKNYNIKEIRPLDIQRSKILNGRPLVIIFEAPVDVHLIINELTATSVFDNIELDYISNGSGFKMEDEINIKESLIPLSTFPNDPFFFRQWGLNNDGTFSLSPSIVGADVNMVEAWDITVGSSNVVMAVIDSGIKMDHPEFAGRILVNQLELNNGIDDDNNGYIDDILGWDFVNNDNDPTDDHGHGTNVTGIAVANSNNGIGYTGVDWNCKLLPLKVLNQNNSGFNSNIIASIYYAINRGAHVISISIGGSGFSTIYENAILAAYNQNIPVIACMMNFNNNVSYYPAAFSSSIAVGSTNSNDYRSVPFFWSPTSGSNYGNHIDVVGPGNFIYGLSHTSNTNYNTYWGGTSQATPLVSGIVSLMLSIQPNLTVEEIRSILRNTAQDQVGNPNEDVLGWDQFYGSGRVNAFEALLYLQNLNSEMFASRPIYVYPNPVMDKLYIHDNSANSLEDIKILDVSGRLVKKMELFNTSIDVSNLNTGIYFLSFDYNGKSKVFKFIKK
jgi:thermitase